jgi:hypothetical protein
VWEINQKITPTPSIILHLNESESSVPNSLCAKGVLNLSKFFQKCYSSPLFSGMSTVHAIFIIVMSVYLVFFSNLFSDQLDGPVTFQSLNLSNFTLEVSDVHIESHSTVLFFAGIYSSFSPFVSYYLFILSSFCWVLRHWPRDDILGLSFPWWNGACKWICCHFKNNFQPFISFFLFFPLCS